MSYPQQADSIAFVLCKNPPKPRVFVGCFCMGFSLKQEQQTFLSLLIIWEMPTEIYFHVCGKVDRKDNT